MQHRKRFDDAGIHQHLKLWELNHADWEHVLSVDLSGTFFVTKAFIDDLKAKGRAAKLASRRLAYVSTDIKNKALNYIAEDVLFLIKGIDVRHHAEVREQAALSKP